MSEDDPSSPRARKDRRGAPRFAVEWSVDCETEDTFLYASIANVSALGIFVRTTEPLAPGTELGLRFAPAGGIEPFVMRGRVQWVNKVRPSGGNPNPGMGIKFIDLEPAERERLVAVIKTIAYLGSDPEPSN